MKQGDLMNKLSYHLILVNSSLSVLIDQVNQMCKCAESTVMDVSVNRDPPSALGCNKQKASFAEASAGRPKHETSIQNSVYEKIIRTRKDITFVQIQKKTGFNRKQIANAIYKLKKRNMIEAKRRGVYITSGRSIK